MQSVQFKYPTCTQTPTLTFLLKTKGIHLLFSELRPQLTESERTAIFDCASPLCTIRGTNHIPLHTLLACADPDNAIVKDVLRLLPRTCQTFVAQIEEWSQWKNAD